MNGKYPLFCVWVFLIFFLISAQKSYGASLFSISDTISTSRPSASAPITANQAANATQVTIYDNGSIFLASDSAVFRPDTGETLNTVTVASMSAANTPSASQRILYFVGLAANTHHSGDPVVTGISAMHTIQFTVPNSVPVSGKIVITWPALTSGDANNEASPSATTFQGNDLDADDTTLIQSFDDSTDISGNITESFANPSSGTSPTLTLTLDASTSIAANSVVKIYIGCTTATSSSCSAQTPRLINPTKTNTAGTGKTWVLNVTTQDTNSVEIDSGKTAISNIESVQVVASVDPTLTFTIGGISDATAINTGNTTGCTNTEATNTGIASTATTVNLGTLGSGQINISAQLITITTNGVNGYSLTATSSGHLINPTTGFFINDSTTPTVMTAGTPWFGAHACGLDVTSGTWATGATGGGAGAKYGWPTQTSSVSLASDSTGPIANSITAGNGLTSVEYASTVSVIVPAGIYRSVVTYVATATF